MEGSVLLQGMAQLWKGVYCCSSCTIIERSVLLQGMDSYERECTVSGSGKPLHTTNKLVIRMLH